MGCLSVKVAQVDLVPTMALLLGLPIPKNSLGSVITEFVSVVEEGELRVLNGFLNVRFRVSPCVTDKCKSAI
jgi:arylsulfatase A-like enzyme